MPSFRHKRTGRIVEVPESDAFRFNNYRYEVIDDQSQNVLAGVAPVGDVPDGTVAEVLAWAGDDELRRFAALVAEKAGKKRKGIIDALS